jgi:hypothetical protein
MMATVPEVAAVNGRESVVWRRSTDSVEGEHNGGKTAEERKAGDGDARIRAHFPDFFSEFSKKHSLTLS